MGRSDCPAGAGSPLDVILVGNEAKVLFHGVRERKSGPEEGKTVWEAAGTSRDLAWGMLEHLGCKEQTQCEEEGMALPTHPCWITVTSKCPVLAGTWHIWELAQPRLLSHQEVPSKTTQLAGAQVTQGH